VGEVRATGEKEREVDSIINDKQIDKCRTFSCDHKLHEDCINELGKEIDEMVGLLDNQECDTAFWKTKCANELQRLYKAYPIEMGPLITAMREEGDDALSGLR